MYRSAGDGSRPHTLDLTPQRRDASTPALSVDLDRAAADVAIPEQYAVAGVECDVPNGHSSI
jgi:hypothetical protein